jgi:hypothetical protein
MWYISFQGGHNVKNTAPGQDDRIVSSPLNDNTNMMTTMAKAPGKVTAMVMTMDRIRGMGSPHKSRIIENEGRNSSYPPPNYVKN